MTDGPEFNEHCQLSEADREAVSRLVTANPVWTGMTSAAEAFGLNKNVLLHAGPPFESSGSITRPILNSAIVAAVFEGLAEDFGAAEHLISHGEIQLEAAQNHRVVTPLAAVVSASMPLHRVEHIDSSDRGADPSCSAYAPINGGSAPSLRLGLRSVDVLEHIRWLNSDFADFLTAAHQYFVHRTHKPGVPLLPIAAAGLSQGDDCHGRTPESNKALFDQLLAGSESSPAPIGDFISTSPSLFLNLWMAATKSMMQRAENVSGSSLVVAAGGNGLDCGIQVSGFPGRWFTDTAEAPVGLLDVDLPAERVIGAIGDSSIIEVYGLGAMAIQGSPAQKQMFAHYLPDNLEQRLEQLPAVRQPNLGEVAPSIGCCAGNVVRQQLAPIVALGMIDNQGEHGRLGGGIHEMPLSVFEAATLALAS